LQENLKIDQVSDPAAARTAVAEQEAPPQFIRVSQKHAMEALLNVLRGSGLI
jgi:hypothetical protein